MATSEPQHYWPADKIAPKAAKPVEPEAPHEPGEHLTPFQMTDGTSFMGNGSELLFEPVFFSTEVEAGPKAPQPLMDPETVRRSIGE